MTVLINIDVPDLAAAVAFYTEAFALTVGRRFGTEAVELTGWPSPVYLLCKDAGTIGAGNSPRSYDRHWTPVHLDVVVDDIGTALGRALKAGAILEHDVRRTAYGKIAILADPFGHGLCLIEFIGSGYDEIVNLRNQ
jgi:predicted enzyme related to lactoylglutathione lyase